MSEFVTKVYSLDNFFAKQQKDGSVDVVGYGSVFCQKDLHEDVVERGAFTESLINFTRKNEMPKMFYEHNPKHTCGFWQKAFEDEYGLKLFGKVNASESKVVKEILEGMVSGLSIGFYLKESFMHHGIRYITKLDLIEISLVSRPANEHARVMPLNQRVSHGQEQFRRR